MKKTILVSMLFLLILIQHSINACTGFTSSDENTTLVGSNEDWYQYDFWVRFLPAQNGRYGRMIIENLWPISPDPNWHCPQVGMNDQGLFYDCFATPRLVPIDSRDKPYYYDSSDHYRYSLESYCLSVCSTIDEVLDVYDSYNLEHMGTYQAFWVDKYGNSIIVEGDDIVYRTGDYQVVTNFYQTHPNLGGYPCWRYETAINMLEDMDELSVEYFTSICDATHQTGMYPSVYSNVYDLTNGIAYLYYFYNYDQVVEFNLEEELALGEHVYFLEDLFEDSNSPPNKPSIPIGPSTGKIREEFTYQCQTTDPEEDQIQYIFNWGDGTDSGWLGPYNSGENCVASHTWNIYGTYNIRVKAKDPSGRESEWSEPLSVSMPKNKGIFNRIFLHFFENLQYLMKNIPSIFFLNIY